jgi:hypothetical protein
MIAIPPPNPEDPPGFLKCVLVYGLITLGPWAVLLYLLRYHTNLFTP